LNGMRKGLLFVVSGPSGAGKTTVMEKVLELQGEKLIFSISYTTRKPRITEVDGVQYHFIDRLHFDRLIEQGDFLEYAQVHGHYYGTSRSFVYPLLEKGQDVLLDIDVQGALNVKKALPEAILIFLAPPSLRELATRLRKRATEKKEEVYQRLADSKWEMSHIRDFQYLIVNRSVERSVRELEAIIEAYRCLVVSRAEELRAFEEEMKDFKIESEE
ncbi:MAG: guanylate kinase, partial [Thermotogota bacterium]